jgi:hypothetical protein
MITGRAVAGSDLPRWCSRVGYEGPPHPASEPYSLWAEPFVTRTPIGLPLGLESGDSFFHAHRKDTFDRAAQAARKHRLRAYDAVQLAVFLEVQQLHQQASLAPVTLVSADRDLNAAASAEGLPVEDPNTHP